MRSLRSKRRRESGDKLRIGFPSENLTSENSLSQPTADSLRPSVQAQLAPRFGITGISPKNLFFGEKEERRSPDEKTQSVFEQGEVSDDAATGTFA